MKRIVKNILNSFLSDCGEDVAQREAEAEGGDRQLRAEGHQESIL
jgi:hypothetical protein